MADLILNHVFGFIMLVSLLHALDLILKFQGRPGSSSPNRKSARSLLWGFYVLFFSVSYVSAVSNSIRRDPQKYDFFEIEARTLGQLSAEASQGEGECLPGRARARFQSATRNYIDVLKENAAVSKNNRRRSEVRCFP